MKLCSLRRRRLTSDRVRASICFDHPISVLSKRTSVGEETPDDSREWRVEPMRRLLPEAISMEVRIEVVSPTTEAPALPKLDLGSRFWKSPAMVTVEEPICDSRPM